MSKYLSPELKRVVMFGFTIVEISRPSRSTMEIPEQPGPPVLIIRMIMRVEAKTRHSRGSGNGSYLGSKELGLHIYDPAQIQERGSV
jgi:hypothetical protein